MKNVPLNSAYSLAARIGKRVCSKKRHISHLTAHKKGEKKRSRDNGAAALFHLFVSMTAWLPTWLSGLNGEKKRTKFEEE